MITAEFTHEINDLITENLYQWDTYQTLKISGIDFGAVTPRVHFANKKSNEALVVNAVLKSDGSVEVSIPDTLLAEKYDIVGYVYTNTGLTSKTIKSITIPIIPRLKPSEYYQPSNEDIAEIEAIELEAKAIIDSLYASEYNSTETYKRPNIVYYNHNAYMCNSNVEITGIPPTDTTVWQMMCEGSVVTGINKDANGNLVFIFSSGHTYTFDMTVKETELVDNNDIPALNLTANDVNNVKNLSDFQWQVLSTFVDFTEIEPNANGLFQIEKGGLYLVEITNVDGTSFNVYCNRLMWIPNKTTSVKYMLSEYPYSSNAYVQYNGAKGTGKECFEVSNTTEIKIDRVVRLMRFD